MGLRKLYENTKGEETPLELGASSQKTQVESESKKFN